MKTRMSGFKVFEHDWTYFGKQYDCPGVFKENMVSLGDKQGISFCKRAIDCFYCYSLNPENRISEVIALGDVVEVGNICYTNKIKLVREISWEELLQMVNYGQKCSGFENIGDRNIGDKNIGNDNKGHINIGNGNEGHANIGDDNKGNKNIGNDNKGDEIMEITILVITTMDAITLEIRITEMIIKAIKITEIEILVTKILGMITRVTGTAEIGINVIFLTDVLTQPNPKFIYSINLLNGVIVIGSIATLRKF